MVKESISLDADSINRYIDILNESSEGKNKTYLSYDRKTNTWSEKKLTSFEVWLRSSWIGSLFGYREDTYLSNVIPQLVQECKKVEALRFSDKNPSATTVKCGLLALRIEKVVSPSLLDTQFDLSNDLVNFIKNELETFKNSLSIQTKRQELDDFKLLTENYPELEEKFTEVENKYKKIVELHEKILELKAEQEKLKKLEELKTEKEKLREAVEEGEEHYNPNRLIDQQGIADNDFKVNIKPILKKEESFMESLNNWLKDETITGEKEIAFNRIKKAFEEKQSRLSLYNLNLSKLPSCIGSLSELKFLSLDRNSLTSLPPEIGNLRKLIKLSLEGNALTSLPPEIGNLSELLSLSLGSSKEERLESNINLALHPEPDYGNKLTTLPKEIGNLTKLKILKVPNNNLDTLPETIGKLTELEILDLRNNNLSSLPSTIGQLLELKELYLKKNKLTEIPNEITQLFNLKKLSLSSNNLTTLPLNMGNLLGLEGLSFHNNPELSEVPFSLGQVPGLSYLDTSGTKISDEMRHSILALCQSKREDKALESFPTRVNAWLAYGDHQMDLEKFDQFDDDQKKLINEWLFRLEKTDDFRGCQKKLAKVVCGILQTLIDNKEFQKFFFPQVHVNNEECHDRAAMALNELYVIWRLLTYDKEMTTKEKISFMVQAAKTLTLRDILMRKIGAWEKKNGILKESVETFLYYETKLKKELDLLTVITYMSYKTIGKRDWIDEKELIEQVNKGYLTTLISGDVFQKMIERETSFQKLWGKEEKEYEDDLEIIGDVTFKDISTDEEFRKLWIATANKYLEEKITEYDQGTYLKLVDIIKEQKEQAKQKRMTEWTSKV